MRLVPAVNFDSKRTNNFASVAGRHVVTLFNDCEDELQLHRHDSLTPARLRAKREGPFRIALVIVPNFRRYTACGTRMVR
jgi:hypothetical protein